MAFAYPWFLLALLAVAVPVIIHLFELRRPQRVLFTNVSFLQEAKLITARQRKLKHLLVLLARMGAVVFLVLIFCQPFIPAPNQTPADGANVSVLVDTSPSMQAAGSDEVLAFERALQEAEELADVYPSSARFQLDGGTRGSLTPAAYRAALGQLAISGQHKSWRSLLISANGDGRDKKQLFIFSDFQKNNFPVKDLLAIDSTQQVFLVPLGGNNAPNVYVDSVLLDDAFVRTNADLTLRIRLRNGGSAKAAQCQVKLFVGEQQAAAFQVTVEAGQAVTTPVRVRLTTAGLQRCRVEVEDYPVSFDNTYYFTLQPAAPIQILDVASGVPPTQRLYRNEPLFSYSYNAPQRIDYRLLAATNLIILQELPRIDTGLREQVRQAVQRGGTVVIIPAAEVAGRESYTQLFQSLGIGQVQWLPVAAGTPFLQPVMPPSNQNPFFRDVFGPQARQVVMPKVAPVLRWSRSGTEVLRLRDGDPYVAGFASGKGSVYVFAAPFGGGYSDFTSHALFVPVMYRLAMQSFRATHLPAYRLNQGTIALAAEETGNRQQVFKLTKDSLTFIPAQRAQAGEVRFDVPPGMKNPGFYELRHDGRPVSTLAFNLDKQESALAHYSAAELRALIGPNRPNIQVYEAEGTQSVAAQYKANQVGTPLWKYCLWVALACLLAEVLLLRLTYAARPAPTPATAI